MFHLNKQHILAILLSRQGVVKCDKSMKIQSCHLNLHKRSVIPPVSRCGNGNLRVILMAALSVADWCHLSYCWTRFPWEFIEEKCSDQQRQKSFHFDKLKNSLRTNLSQFSTLILNKPQMPHTKTTFLPIDKGHVKIMLIPVIALSFPHFCPKLEQTLHIHQEQHSWHAGNFLFWKKCIEIPKNAILCVRVVCDQLFNVNGPPAQAQRDELVTRLSFEETVEFLQAEEFVLWETLVQSPETLV